MLESNPKTETFTIRVHEDIADQVRQAAIREKCSINSWFIRLVGRELEIDLNQHGYQEVSCKDGKVRKKKYIVLKPKQEK